MYFHLFQGWLHLLLWLNDAVHLACTERIWKGQDEDVVHSPKIVTFKVFTLHAPFYAKSKFDG